MGQIEFQELYDSFRSKIFCYVMRLVGEAEAEDLTQEIFIKISQALPNFRGESSLSTWVYRIATNAALDKLRRASFQPEVLDDEVDNGSSLPDDTNLSAEQQLVRKEMNECIQGFIDRLPENCRLVLVLSELEGLKNQEIADILGTSLDTVKIRLHRARQRLQEELRTHCDFYWIEENEFVPNLTKQKPPS